MFMKRLLLCALLAVGMIGAVATPLLGLAATSFDIQLNFGPPAPRVERIPAPRAGYVWSPGHWQWSVSGYRHVWVAGHWVKARPGYVYRVPRWVDCDGRWYYEAPRWDRDGDGIPNRFDVTPCGRGLAVAPPPPRHEVVPRPRSGYVWSPGHYEWITNAHVWIGGTWYRHRPGYTYHPPRWIERNGRWHFEARRWDRDGDGVPDRRDSRPGDPTQR